MSKELVLSVPNAGEVSAIAITPPSIQAMFVLAHGAGAGMRHPFMQQLSEQLAERQVGTLRYAFPYMHHGRRRPDPAPLLALTVRAAVALGTEHAAGRPIIAGGKSMGGRMTSMAAAAEPLAGVRGIAFVGFPLHPARKPGTSRAAHLGQVDVPLLFIQGTRDALADLDLLRPIITGLGPRAQLHVVEGADHGFGVPKRTGRPASAIMAEIADALAAFAIRA